MYTCALRINVVGLPDEAVRAVQSIQPLAAFTHEVQASSAGDLSLAPRADVVVAALEGHGAADGLAALVQAKAPGATLVVVADRKTAQALEPWPDALDDLWFLPLGAQELRFRLERLLRQRKERADLWQTSQYLDATIDSIPSLVWYKTRDGVHEKVNQSFCDTVRKTKEQVQGQRHAYIWDVEEDDPACIESEAEVMASGRTCVSEEEVLTGEGQRLLTTYKSPLYDLDGTVMGTVGVGIDITQERAYEQDLLEKNRTLETIFTSLDCGVLIHSLDGTRILGVNQSALDILGYESEQQLVDDGFATISPTVADEDREHLLAAIGQLHQVGDSVSTQYRVKRDDGSLVHVMGDLKLIEKDGERFIQRFLLDITDQKHSEEMRERRQRSLMQALSADYLVVGALNLETGEGELLRVSTDQDEELGLIFEGGQGMRRSIERYIDSRVLDEDRPMLREALGAESIRLELSTQRRFDRLYRVCKDDRAVYRQVSVVGVDGPGEDSTVVIGFRNVDQQIREELEQKSLLEKALTDANRASQAKSNFLLNMSHDIRTPMNAIVGFTTLACNHLQQPQKMQDYLDKIKASSNHLLGLINDVLDMSRIEQGKVSLEEDACDLAFALEDLMTILQTEAQAKGLDLSVDASGVEHPLVICDRLKVNQVLFNLLGNSLKFTPGGGSVRATLSEAPGSDEGRGLYSFVVEDTGIGMGEDFIEHIFDPFERERTQTISGVQGSGLGMAIVKNLVDMMKGTVAVESAVGEGTRFTVTLPLRFAEGVPAEEAGALRAKDALELLGSKDYRVLLVDDNLLNREIACELLESVGFTVESVVNGQEAVDAVAQADPDHYDLVLMDIQMPVMNGYEAAQAIRRLDDDKRSGLPILAVTADAFDEDRQRALDSGMNGHLPKPIDVDKLFEIMGTLLS